ncbi:MAG: hypothetical protein V2I40_02245 [Desulfobacteraceae bacterium]|jgi:hypothetical protein|nr:hypothetical protein [Desulfobacteraceae bacterium]
MIAINRINWNREIWRKILNSVAAKYDCGVRFTLDADRINFEGNPECAEEIVKEALSLVSGNEWSYDNN